MKKLINQVVLAVLTGAVLMNAAGCGARKEEEVAVQSVASLSGMSAEIASDRYAGIVTSGKQQEIRRQEGRKIASVNVKAGDTVTEGQVLFTYDAQESQNNLDKAKLELEQLKNTLEAKTSQKKQLEADKKKAGADAQLEYTLQIQETDAAITEANYNISTKQKEIDTLKAWLKDLSVSAPFDGRIESDDSYDTSDSQSADLQGDEPQGSLTNLSSGAFIKIVNTDQVRVMGKVNEANIGDLSVDLPMIIRSRTDETKIWSGILSSVDTKSTLSDSSAAALGGGEGDGEMTNSSKYPFYVTIENPEGLMIGQHVYIDTDHGKADQEAKGLHLPSGYIEQVNAQPFVYAEGEDGRLEKRTVALGEYDSSDDSYPVTAGLDVSDYIAWPEKDMKLGAPCREQEDGTEETGSFSAAADSVYPAEEEAWSDMPADAPAQS
jgi:HlyD family secretion protein